MFPSIDDDTPIHYFRAGMRLVIQYRVLFGDDDYATIYLLTHSRQSSGEEQPWHIVDNASLQEAISKAVHVSGLRVNSCSLQKDSRAPMYTQRYRFDVDLSLSLSARRALGIGVEQASRCEEARIALQELEKKVRAIKEEASLQSVDFQKAKKKKEEEEKEKGRWRSRLPAVEEEKMKQLAKDIAGPCLMHLEEQSGCGDMQYKVGEILYYFFRIE